MGFQTFSPVIPADITELTVPVTSRWGTFASMAGVGSLDKTRQRENGGVSRGCGVVGGCGGVCGGVWGGVGGCGS